MALLMASFSIFSLSSSSFNSSSVNRAGSPTLITATTLLSSLPISAHASSTLACLICITSVMISSIRFSPASASSGCLFASLFAIRRQ
jgi:hypothetical protein